MYPDPLVQDPRFSRDDDARPAMRLDVQRHHLDALRLARQTGVEIDDVPQAPSRLTTLAGAMRDSLGNALIDLGERIRPYRPEPAARSTHGQ